MSIELISGAARFTFATAEHIARKSSNQRSCGTNPASTNYHPSRSSRAAAFTFLTVIRTHTHTEFVNIELGGKRPSRLRKRQWKPIYAATSYLTDLFFTRRNIKKNQQVRDNRIVVDPIQDSTVKALLRIVRAAPRIVVVSGPVPRLGTALVQRAFCSEMGMDGDVIMVDIAGSSASLDVRIWAALMEKDPSIFGVKFLVEGLMAIIKGIAGALLSDWISVGESLSSSSHSSQLPPLDDEATILNTFHTVLDQTTRQVPDGGIVILDGCEALVRLTKTPVGAKAVGVFLNHLAFLARGPRKVVVVLVCATNMVHDLLLPLAAQEIAVLFSFGDLGKEEAKEHLLDRMADMLGHYNENDGGTRLGDDDEEEYEHFHIDDSGTSTASNRPTTNDTTIECDNRSPDNEIHRTQIQKVSSKAWAQTKSLSLEDASEFFDYIFDMVGGRAMDLAACADLMVWNERHFKSTLYTANTHTSKAQRLERLQKALTWFPDISASARWLESRLDPRLEMPIDGALAPLENRDPPLWTREQAVAVFDAMVSSENDGWVRYDEAVLAAAGVEEGVEAQHGEQKMKGLEALRSMITHGLVQYRPASIFYLDGVGSAMYDTIAPMRPLHLYAYKQLRRQSPFLAKGNIGI
ncbi:hypothetical protein HDV05_003743 [Chytridiales sp. JEL 0842]|nr:hypothetical protein HDV05_003743 [Chytridiales sp. JEL 0842]